jgi:hypothetical protein
MSMMIIRINTHINATGSFTDDHICTFLCPTFEQRNMPIYATCVHVKGPHQCTVIQIKYMKRCLIWFLWKRPQMIVYESLGGSEAVAKASNTGESTKETRRSFEHSYDMCIHYNQRFFYRLSQNRYFHRNIEAMDRVR